MHIPTQGKEIKVLNILKASLHSYGTRWQFNTIIIKIVRLAKEDKEKMSQRSTIMYI